MIIRTTWISTRFRILFMCSIEWMERSNVCRNELEWFLGEHRGLYGVLLFDRFMKHSLHNNLVSLDYSCSFGCVNLTIDNDVNQKSLRTLLDYCAQHRLKFRKLRFLSLEGNNLDDLDITSFCRAVRKGGYKHLVSLNLKSACYDLLLCR